jgi:hypothetical protein
VFKSGTFFASHKNNKDNEQLIKYTSTTHQHITNAERAKPTQAYYDMKLDCDSQQTRGVWIRKQARIRLPGTFEVRFVIESVRAAE